MWENQAQAAVEDEKDAIRRKKNGLPPRAFLLTNGSSSDVKPELSRQYYLAKALENKAPKALKDKTSE
eukprot:symbB.v1.2.031610.t1/scaffold3688.1/size51983/4